MQTRRTSTAKMEGEKEKRKLSDEVESFGRAIDRMNATNIALRKQEMEENQKMRLEDVVKNDIQIKALTAQLAKLEAIHEDNMTANKNIIRYPVPNFDGSNLIEWTNLVLNCKKINGWTEEKTIDLIPTALTGNAAQLFKSFLPHEKLTLDSMFEAFKSRIQPKCKSLHRNLFMKAKRNPGENIRAFVLRCTGYILQAEDASSIGDIPWAESYLMEKVLQTVSEVDRKILCSHGEQKSLEALLQKTDDVVSFDSDFIGSIEQKEEGKSSQIEQKGKERAQNQNSYNQEHNHAHSSPHYVPPCHMPHMCNQTQPLVSPHTYNPQQRPPTYQNYNRRPRYNRYQQYQPNNRNQSNHKTQLNQYQQRQDTPNVRRNQANRNLPSTYDSRQEGRNTYVQQNQKQNYPANPRTYSRPGGGYRGGRQNQHNQGFKQNQPNNNRLN